MPYFIIQRYQTQFSHWSIYYKPLFRLAYTNCDITPNPLRPENNYKHFSNYILQLGFSVNYSLPLSVRWISLWYLTFKSSNQTKLESGNFLNFVDAAVKKFCDALYVHGKRRQLVIQLTEKGKSRNDLSILFFRHGKNFVSFHWI